MSHIRGNWSKVLRLFAWIFFVVAILYLIVLIFLILLALILTVVGFLLEQPEAAAVWKLVELWAYEVSNILYIILLLLLFLMAVVFVVDLLINFGLNWFSKGWRSALNSLNFEAKENIKAAYKGFIQGFEDLFRPAVSWGRKVVKGATDLISEGWDWIAKKFTKGGG